MTETEVDLRGAASSQVQTVAFYAVRDLARGSAVVLLTAERPGLLMDSLNLQLRNLLAWETQASEGRFRRCRRARGLGSRAVHRHPLGHHRQARAPRGVPSLPALAGGA